MNIFKNNAGNGGFGCKRLTREKLEGLTTAAEAQRHIYR
jgi:hypothetical protein